jgi:hypothetical protein
VIVSCVNPVIERTLLRVVAASSGSMALAADHLAEALARAWLCGPDVRAELDPRPKAADASAF